MATDFSLDDTHYCQVTLKSGQRYSVNTSDPDWASKIVRFVFNLSKSDVKHVEIKRRRRKWV